jgi:hypothetical protein
MPPRAYGKLSRADRAPMSGMVEASEASASGVDETKSVQNGFLVRAGLIVRPPYVCMIDDLSSTPLSSHSHLSISLTSLISLLRTSLSLHLYLSHSRSVLVD